MYPLLKHGDLLLIDFFQGSNSLSEVKTGELIVHADANEFMVHRKISDEIIKGDWGYSTWTGPVLGKVVRVKRNNREYSINTSSSLAPWLSSKMLSRNRFVRILNKALLYFFNLFTVQYKSYKSASDS